MRFNDRVLPLVLVGGGSIIIDKHRQFDGVSNVIVPEGFDVANVVGAALSQSSATTDRIIDLEEILDKDSLMNETQQEIDQHPSLSDKEKQTISERTKLAHIEKAREAAMDSVWQTLRDEVIAAGAVPSTVCVLDKEDVSLTYIPGFAKRVKMKVVGELDIVKPSDAFRVPDSVYDKIPVEGHQVTKQTVSTSGKVLIEDQNTTTFTEPNIVAETGEWLLNKYDIECLTIGAGIMGCGGGGNPHIARLLAIETLDMGKKIRVVTPSRYFREHKNGLGAVVAYMGAPLVLYEKLVSGNETINAFN